MFLHLILINSCIKALHPSSLSLSLSLSLQIAWDRMYSFYYDENRPTPRAEYGVSLPITQTLLLSDYHRVFKFDRKMAKTEKQWRTWY
jgi:hypothetical protein